MNDLRTVIEALQDIDFGYAEAAPDEMREQLLRQLEDVVDTLELEFELFFPEADAAIRYFLTDTSLARTYIYGPTDIGDGVGLLDKLIELVHEEENLHV